LLTLIRCGGFGKILSQKLTIRNIKEVAFRLNVIVVKHFIADQLRANKVISNCMDDHFNFSELTYPLLISIAQITIIQIRGLSLASIFVFLWEYLFTFSGISAQERGREDSRAPI